MRNISQFFHPRFAFEEDDGSGSGGNEDEGSSGNENEDADESGSDDKDESGQQESDGKESQKDDFPWDEHNRLKREAAERARKDKDAEREKQKEEGRLSELAESEKKRADEAEAELARIRREGMVGKLGTEAGAIDPEDLPRFLTEEEMSDERSAETAIKRLKERKPHLFGERKRTGGDIDDSEETDEERGTAKGSGPQYGLDRLRSVKRKT